MNIKHGRTFGDVNVGQVVAYYPVRYVPYCFLKVEVCEAQGQIRNVLDLQDGH